MVKKKGECFFFFALSCLSLLAVPASLLSGDFSSGHPYALSFYAEFAPLVHHAERTKKKKILFLGNSSVAFGIDSALVEKEMANEGIDLEACNFGLYGALGSKAMMDFSLPLLHQGDTVVLHFEEYAQAMSLYFSGKEMWRSLDEDRSLCEKIKEQDWPSYLSDYPSFVSEKRELGDKEIAVNGIYALASFDGHGDLKNFERPQNQMSGAFDPDNPIILNESLLNSDFLTAINSYAKTAKSQGAEVLFSYAPMNRKAFSFAHWSLEEYDEKLRDELALSFISDPAEALMEENYFYDSNFHLNEAGMKEHTLRLISDLKNEWGLTKPLVSEHPALPALPGSGSFVQGDDQDQSLFEYEEEDDGYKAVGFASPEGKKRSEIIFPSTYKGKPIRGFVPSLFQNNGVLSSLSLSENVSRIRDTSFLGCPELAKLILKGDDPSKIGVGFGLLDGAPNTRIYVKKSALAQFELDYFWGHYSDRYETY